MRIILGNHNAEPWDLADFAEAVKVIEEFSLLSTLTLVSCVLQFCPPSPFPPQTQRSP